jgi:hypothetical protein
LREDPLQFQPLMSTRKVIFSLKDRGIIEIQNEQISLTVLGHAVLAHLDSLSLNSIESKTDSEKGSHKINDTSLSHAKVLRQQKLEKSNQFLELYKQGLSYQDIGDKYKLSRERVRQILKPNPAFHEYLREREESETAAEEEKEKRAKEDFYSRTLAALYPERVAELWDYEKNSDLKPEDILAGTTQLYV